MRNDIMNLFSIRIRNTLENVDSRGITELRLRTDRPLIIMRGNREFMVSEAGICKSNATESGANFIVKESDVKETLEFITNYSIYAFNEEIRRGFITVCGGHRIGICGKTVYENGVIKTIRNIQSMNVRIAHEVIGCANSVVPYVMPGEAFINTLIVASPGLGKTTLLRDMIRIISDKHGKTIGVVDERSEIASCYLGKPQNNIGIRTDVLDGCLKKEGMVMLVRSMRPDIVAVDEIGSEEDSCALLYCGLCGVGILATIHGSSIEEIEMKPGMEQIMRRNYFKRYVLCNVTSDNRYEKKIFNEKKELIGIVYD